MIACRRVLCGSSVYVQKNLSCSFCVVVVSEDVLLSGLRRMTDGFRVLVVVAVVEEAILDQRHNIFVLSPIILGAQKNNSQNLK